MFCNYWLFIWVGGVWAAKWLERNINYHPKPEQHVCLWKSSGIDPKGKPDRLVTLCWPAFFWGVHKLAVTIVFREWWSEYILGCRQLPAQQKASTRCVHIGFKCVFFFVKRQNFGFQFWLLLDMHEGNPEKSKTWDAFPGNAQDFWSFHKWCWCCFRWYTFRID